MNSNPLPKALFPVAAAFGRRGAAWICLLVLASLSGCASQPPAPAAAPADRSASREASHTDRVVQTALAQLDKPYRYGGEGPRSFDCSGLVFYAYRHSGIEIPRTSHEQQRQARPIPMRAIAPGDLLFFRESRKVTHVGLYVGDGRFIHASTGRGVVKLSSLEDPYWQQHLIGAGRYSD